VVGERGQLKSRRLAVLMAVAVLAGVVPLTGLVPLTSAQAQTTYRIRVGKFFGSAPAESMRFFPQRIRVHEGDILRFTSRGFHTATLLPIGQVPEQWVQDYARAPRGPWAFANRDPDDRAFKANNAALLPTRFDCGDAGNPCEFDGSGSPTGGVLNSGLPINGPMNFHVEVDAEPGETFWVLCLVHQRMTMRVQVVPDAVPASDPGALEERRLEKVASDRSAAESLHARLSKRRSFHFEGGTKVYDAWAGFDTKHISLLAMYPQVLNVRKGEKVQWHFDTLFFEDHTVSFPKKKAARVASNSFVPGCDPDGDAGPGPDTPPNDPDTICSNPSQVEFDIQRRFVMPRGDGVVSNHHSYDSSGIVGGNFSFGEDQYTLRFSNPSRRAYKYLCLIHPFMQGRVNVRR
jgi:plastocyanin